MTTGVRTATETFSIASGEASRAANQVIAFSSSSPLTVVCESSRLLSFFSVATTMAMVSGGVVAVLDVAIRCWQELTLQG
nr:hypothetical protein Iba_chr03bCG5630 [Ipomoea batatas]GMC73749.1 hypothetical protein Iba_chr03cCG3690 [Ipomoea batatas]GMC73750.1 hypothetical protein Iba_chr03cCG3700 [Ipomoea batatas]